MFEFFDRLINNIPQNGGECLLFKWWRRSVGGRHRKKLYFLFFLCIASMLLFFIFLRSIGEDSYSSRHQYLIGTWMVVNIVMLLIGRFQLPTIPALISLSDLYPLRFDSLRVTPVSSWEILVGMFRISLFASVIPFTILMFIEIVVVLNLPDMFFTSRGEIPFLYWLLTFLGLMAVGFSLAGLGYIGVLLIRKPIGAVVGAFLPVIILFTSVIFPIAGYYDLFTDEGPLTWLFTQFLFLALPDLFFIFGLDQGSIDTPVGDISFGFFLVNLVFQAVLIWGILFRILQIRRA